MRSDRALLLVRFASGVVFVAFGVGKFVNHGSELASLKTYAVPAPEFLVFAIGIVELLGGTLLIAGATPRWRRSCWPAMCSARSSSPASPREIVSLTLARAQLAAMLILIRRGPGAYRLR